MNKYIKYTGPAILALGLALSIFGVVCLCGAADGIGRLEDAYYYLDMNLYHGRFDSCDAGEVLDMLDDIGLSGAVIGGFERFAIGARYPFLIIGILVAAAGALLTFRTGIEIPEKAAENVAGVWNRAGIFIAAVIEWLRMKFSGSRCPVCGERLIKGALYCGNCGAGLKKDADADT